MRGYAGAAELASYPFRVVMHRPRMGFGVNFPRLPRKEFEVNLEVFESGERSIMVTVYVLRSQSSTQHYVGITKDLPRRLEEHDHGRSHARVIVGRGTCFTPNSVLTMLLLENANGS